MIDIKDKIRGKIKKLQETDFFSIFIATILSKVVTFLGGIILVRILSKSDYGIYAYIKNCYSMLFIFNDFGISFAALQYMTESADNKEKQKQILKYSIKCCLLTSLVTGIIILVSPKFYPYKIGEAISIIPMLFLLPTISILINLFSMVLRANLENKKYAKLQIFTTIITYIVLIIFACVCGVRGAILSEYVYSIIILIYSVILAYQYIHNILKNKKSEITRKEKNGFIKYALAGQLNDTMGSILLNVDIFLIGYMISIPENIALYNAGAKIPYALTFLSNCVSIYITPYFIKHNKEIEWIKVNYKNLIKYCSIGFGVMCIALVCLAKPIFMVVFGADYYDAIPIYRVLIIGLFFTSAIKIPTANVLVSLRKINVNIISNIICIIVNFVSNIAFIKFFGIIGAAITTTITNIISATIYIIYLNRYIKKNYNEKNKGESR